MQVMLILINSVAEELTHRRSNWAERGAAAHLVIVGHLSS